jgi:hypothetical protein
MSESTKGYRIADEPVTDAVGEEFGRLIAERDRLQNQLTIATDKLWSLENDAMEGRTHEP